MFWMAFQGVFQSLTQLAIGTILPGNDVGRALAYLRVGAAAKLGLLVLAVAAMALAGSWLARAWPASGEQRTDVLTRAFVKEMLLTAMAAVVLIIPFRLPRNVVEVALVPLFVNLIGIGWLALGAVIVKRRAVSEDPQRLEILRPAFALGVILLLFLTVLRTGIAI